MDIILLLTFQSNNEIVNVMRNKNTIASHNKKIKVFCTVPAEFPQSVQMKLESEATVIQLVGGVWEVERYHQLPQLQARSQKPFEIEAGYETLP